MSLAELLAGFACGVALGAWNGHDLGASVARFTQGAGRGGAMLGLVKRTAILAAALVISLRFGRHAWVGVAAGYMLGFAVMVRRETRARVG